MASWVDRKTNEKVLIMVCEKREQDRITKTKKKWIGHIIRDNILLKDMIEGRVDGKRPRGMKSISQKTEQ